LATPLIVAAIAARKWWTARPGRTHCLIARSRRLAANPIATSRVARTTPESRALSARWAISHWRTISARGTATRGPITGRPIARRSGSAAIEAWGPRWSSWLLPSRRINWTSIATPSLLRSTRQHPPFASLGQLSSGQIGIAGERIEATTATTEASGTSTPTTATASARTARTATSTAAAIPTTAILIAATRIRVAPTFGPRHHVRDVVEFAFLLGVGRRLVTRQDAHQAHPGRALAHHRQRLHQT
jgi:hypothetical protein